MRDWILQAAVILLCLGRVGDVSGSDIAKSDLVVRGTINVILANGVGALIARMAWQPDRSYWASQEWEYNAFFEYPWTLEAMAESLAKVPRDVALPIQDDSSSVLSGLKKQKGEQANAQCKDVIRVHRPCK